MGVSDPRISRTTGLCTRPPQEVLFTSIVAGLLAEGRLPPGSIFDVGANRGLWACYWASTDPNRTVHAMDPDPYYIQTIRNNYGHIRNLRPMLGALSSRMRHTSYDEAVSNGMRFFKLSKEALQSGLTVYRLDDLFDCWREERLAFAQFDVDGHEQQVLRGARAIIMRDRPLFSTELHVHEDADRSRALLNEIKSLGYASYLIEEVAGSRADIRNLLNIPHERTQSLRGSHILDLAAQSRRLFAVDSNTIMDFAYPCCARGGPCCPIMDGGRTPSCCSHWRVSQWMTRVLNRGGADLQWGSRTTWYDQQYWVWGPQLAHVQQQEMRRNATLDDVIGLSYNRRPPEVQVAVTNWTLELAGAPRSRQRGHVRGHVRGEGVDR
jgi:FkbM family methyltransferase